MNPLTSIFDLKCCGRNAILCCMTIHRFILIFILCLCNILAAVPFFWSLVGNVFIKYLYFSFHCGRDDITSHLAGKLALDRGLGRSHQIQRCKFSYFILWRVSEQVVPHTIDLLEALASSLLQGTDQFLNSFDTRT